MSTRVLKVCCCACMWCSLCPKSSGIEWAVTASKAVCLFGAMCSFGWIIYHLKGVVRDGRTCEAWGGLLPIGCQVRALKVYFALCVPGLGLAKGYQCAVLALGRATYRLVFGWSRRLWYCLGGKATRSDDRRLHRREGHALPRLLLFSAHSPTPGTQVPSPQHFWVV